MTINYDPETHWDNIGKKSKSGLGQKAKFGTDQTGKSQYDIPSFGAPPKFIDYIKIGSKVLDIGSGIGLEVIKLIKKGIDANGCDLSRELIKVAQDNCKEYGISTSNIFYKWNGYNLPFYNNSYDVITTNTVLQHVIDEIQIERIFKEVKRVLITKGYFCMSELVAPIDFQSTHHVNLRSVKSYIELGEKNGLRLVNIFYTPMIIGSILYYYQKMFGIEHWVKQKVNNSPADTLNIAQIKKISFKKRIYKNLLYLTNCYINPLIKLSKVEKYFTAQVSIIFIKDV
jgi:ubiquinone/menaquinone biosynthesis C-methylase UbiE